MWICNLFLSFLVIWMKKSSLINFLINGDQKIKLNQILWRSTAITLKSIKKEKIMKIQLFLSKLKNFRHNKGLQRGRRWSFHLLSFSRLENQKVISTSITSQPSLVGSNLPLVKSNSWWHCKHIEILRKKILSAPMETGTRNWKYVREWYFSLSLKKWDCFLCP